MKVQPYLNFDGQTEAAFKFYQSVFGGEFLTKMKMKEGSGGGKLQPGEEDRIMHISLPIGGDVILMGSDILPSAGHKLQMGNNLYISLHPDSKEEADSLFNGLSEGGKIEMPMEDQFWGDYFGSFVDKFGVHWMVNYDKRE